MMGIAARAEARPRGRRACDRRRSAARVLATLWSLAAGAAGADPLDPVVASPDKYRVLLENEHVRVVEYVVAPGESDAWHTHPPKVSYVVAPGRLRITTAGGESFEVEEAAGSVRWLGAVGRHFGTNVGDTTVRIVFVELKGLAGSGDDLQQFIER